MKAIDFLASSPVELNGNIEAMAIRLMLAVTLLLLSTWLASALLRRRSAAARHWLWSASLLCCLLLPLFVFTLPQWQLPVTVQLSDVTGDALLNPSDTSHRAPIESDIENEPLVDSGEDDASDSSEVEQTGASASLDREESVGAAAPNPDHAESSATTAVFDRGNSTLFIWFGVWLVGFVLAGASLVRGWLFRWSLQRRSSVIKDRVLTNLLSELLNQVRIRRPVKLLRIDADIVPLTWGLFRPVIALPASYREWDERRLRIVLLHELAHIRRLDYPVQLLARVACALYWFHPLVWLGLTRLRFERELACDDRVVGHGVRASDYAAELMAIARGYRGVVGEAAIGMARVAPLRVRLERLFDGERSHRPLSRWSLAGMAAGMVMVAAAAATGGFQDGESSGNVAAIAQDDRPRVDAHGDPLPNGALLSLGNVQFKGLNYLAGMALSPDEKTLITIENEAIVAWDVATGRTKWRKDPTLGIVNGTWVMNAKFFGIQPLCFSPDGRKCFSTGKLGEVLVWDVATGRLKEFEIDYGDHRRPGPADMFKSIDIASSGELIALGTDSALYVCDLNGQILYSVNNDPQVPMGDEELRAGQIPDRLRRGGEFSYARFSPDGSRLALVNSESPREIRILTAADGTELKRIETSDRVVRMDIGPGGDFIVATERDTAVRKYEIASGEEIWSVTFPEVADVENYTSCVLISPIGNWVATGVALGLTREIRIFDYQTGTEIASLPEHHDSPWVLAVTRDGSRLYSNDSDHRLIGWHGNTFQPIPIPYSRKAIGPSRASSVAPLAAFLTNDGLIRLIDTGTGSEVLALEPPNTHYAMEFSPDGKFIATGGKEFSDREIVDAQIIVWEIDTGRPVHRWDWPVTGGFSTILRVLTYSKDGRYLAAALAGQDRGYVFDLHSGELAFQFDHPKIQDVAFSPDSRIIASAGLDHTIEYREVQGDGTSVIRTVDVGDWMESTVGVYKLRFSPDGVSLVSSDSRLAFWNASDLSFVAVTESIGSDPFLLYDISKDGAWMLMRSDEGEIAIVDVASRKMVWSKQAHHGFVSSLSFGYGGKTVLSGGSDGVCYLWDVTPERIVQRPMEQLYRDLMGSAMRAVWNAHWAMLADPDNAVSLLGERLIGEIEEVEASRVQPLIADLGSESFETRSSAQRALNEIGPGVEPLLQAALERATAAEQVSRIREVLRELKREVYLRPLAVLNGIDTDESRRVLRQLAAEGPDTYIGRQARRLLEE